MSETGQRIIVFGATADGRRIACMLAKAGIPTRLCFAAGCGEELVEQRESLTITSKRMKSDEMSELITQSGCELVIDATHPFAREITANVRIACDTAGVELVRLVREKSLPDNVVRVDTVQQAAELLNRTTEKALLTVGSKELGVFTKVKDYQTRLFVRVLPTVETLQKCLALGFSASHLICLQGPFTHEINAATIKLFGVSCIVTKDSGYAGGLFEKLSAVSETGCRMILIRQVDEPEQGLQYEAICALLSEKFGVKPVREMKILEKREELQPHFPIFVNLKGRRVALVGGGDTAYKRAKTLIKFGAEICVIAPELSPEMTGLVRDSKVSWLRIGFAPQLLEGSDLVVAATNLREVNRAVSEAAKKMQMLANVTDIPEESSFLFPTVVQNDAIVAGFISADNDYAAIKRIAKKLREKLVGGRL